VIYFLQPVEGGPVEIGSSEDVDLRRQQLESHYGRPLALLATMPGGRREEEVVHARFAHLRCGQTEQFRPGPGLMAFIGRPLLVEPNPDAVAAMGGENPFYPVRLDFTPEVHQMLRVVAAEQGKPMAVFARQVVERAVRELYHKRGRG
jgi:hypothetical protein